MKWGGNFFYSVDFSLAQVYNMFNGNQRGKRMDISKIDKNFNLNTTTVEDGMRYYTIPHEGFALYGIYYDKTAQEFTRMDRAFANSVNPGVEALYNFTAGGRLRFATDSTTLAIRVTYPFLRLMSHMAIAGQGGFSLLEETEVGVKILKILPPLPHNETGYELTCPLPGGMRNYILHFPLYNAVTSLQIGLDESATVGQGRAYRSVKPILYYGSSITQGGCCSRPDNAYQGLIAKWNNIDFWNYGFSGSALGEPQMADFFAGFDCSLFVCDYDHNAPSVEHLRNTHYAFYERYRKQRPDTPILFLTKPDFNGSADHIEREKIIRTTYRKARANGDKNVYFIAGKSYFKEDRENCMVDGCHPNDLGFYLMAKKVYKKMIEIDEIFR